MTNRFRWLTPGSVERMPVSELVGVYDADGGLLGEAAYVWGRVRELDGMEGSVRAFEVAVRRHLDGDGAA